MLDIKVEDIATFEKELFEYIDTKYPEIVDAIRKEKEISDKTEEALIKAITEFKEQFLNN